MAASGPQETVFFIISAAKEKPFITGPSRCNEEALVKDASYCLMLLRERTAGLSCNKAAEFSLTY